MAENNNGVAFAVTSKNTVTYVTSGPDTTTPTKKGKSSKPQTLKSVVAGKK